ncbi:MAG: ATP-binding cassette domain-containing protein [Acidimicrobiales bacterium]
MESRPKLLEARGLTVRFGSVTALDGLDLVAPPDEVLAVLGPNGAGKTTFVKAVATLVKPSGGQLQVRGNDVSRDQTAVRRDIGLAGQFAAVEPTMTGRENLEMTARLFGHSKRSARSAASVVIEQLDLGEVAERRAVHYSGGQRRRLDLGASLVGAPRLLLLDEPTTGLDPTGRREVWEAVRALVAGGTEVVLTTHYLEEANELADQIVVIDHGRSIASGSVSELKAAVGSDVIDVVVRDPERLSAIGALIEKVTAAHAHLDANARRIISPTKRGAGDLAALIGLLGEADAAVDEIGLRQPTLDEVFFTLTGRVSEQPDPAASDEATQVFESIGSDR